MAVVTKRPAGKDYLDTPKSSLSKTKLITKPEARIPNTHNYGVSQAEKMIAKAHK